MRCSQGSPQPPLDKSFNMTRIVWGLRMRNTVADSVVPRMGAADLMFTHTSLREAMQATTSGSFGRPSNVTWMS